MGCCQSNPNDMNSASEMGKELTDIQLAEYEPNIICLEKKTKTLDQIIKPEPERVSIKESSYYRLEFQDLQFLIFRMKTNIINLYLQYHKDTKSEKQEEESKRITEQPSDIKWSIKQSMFVKINSHKNVGEYYAIKELIGQGGFGKVYKVTHRQTGMVRAMKQILKQRMKKEDQQKLLQETKILMDIDHPNIVKLYEMYQDDNSYYLISEYCEGGELFEKIKIAQFLTEKEIASFLKQILSAVSYCHSMNIVLRSKKSYLLFLYLKQILCYILHNLNQNNKSIFQFYIQKKWKNTFYTLHRDLKPENIVFDAKHQGANLKIIDFGASVKIENSEKLNKKIGTPFYVAPEVLYGSYDEKCDIWSIGVILYVLLCGYPPFFAQNEAQVLAKVKKGTYQFDSQDWAKVSLQAKDLIRRMLFFNPSQRISANDALQHQWITNNKSKGQLNNLSLKKLQDFDSKNKLKYAILQFITVQVITSQEKDELMKNFQEIDKNGDGTVSKEELLNAYTDLIFIYIKVQYYFDCIKLYKGDQLAAQQIVDDLFPHLDANGSGKVDFSEFITASINKDRSLSKKKIEQSFKLFDLDGNGFITKTEINQLFGDEIDDNMWKEILKECDANEDGMISLGEFITLLESKFKGKF